MSKRKKAVIIYGVIILIILITIMFIIPDSVFLKLYEKNVEEIKEKIPKKEDKPIEFIEYKIQKERLLKNQYEYEYVLLDSLSNKSYNYKCSGKVSGKVESGTCTSPKAISYTEKTKKKSFAININYLTPEYIFNKLLKDIEPKETIVLKSREYSYQTKIQDLETEIIVYTDVDNINRIEISNAYMTYIIKISNVSY